MQKRRLGQSEVEVSVIALGCWAFAGDLTWGPQERSASIATIHAALDCGINFLDVAEAYGDGLSEEIVGEALRGRRDQVVLASKVSAGHAARAEVKAACERSLRRLQTDYIDVYYIHWPNRQVGFEETYTALHQLKEEGKIRVIGCANFGCQDLTELLSYGRVETNQLPYSLLWRALEFGLQDLCVQQEVAITCYSPLMQGLLTGKYKTPAEVPAGRARTRLFSSKRPYSRHHEEGAEEEVFSILGEIAALCAKHGLDMATTSLAWLVAQKGVASVLAGARTPEQVRENARAAELKLSPEILAELSRITLPLRDKMGENLDMWQSDSRIR
ncbi:MAG TPA: aldo/keto reductase [Firmicutes bacterium]|nr:aldo/keto reductase [Bacillota bacterium]